MAHGHSLPPPPPPPTVSIHISSEGKTCFIWNSFFFNLTFFFFFLPEPYKVLKSIFTHYLVWSAYDLWGRQTAYFASHVAVGRAKLASLSDLLKVILLTSTKTEYQGCEIVARVPSPTLVWAQHQGTLDAGSGNLNSGFIGNYLRELECDTITSLGLSFLLCWVRG